MYRAWMTCGYRPTPQQKPGNKVRWPGTKRFPTASFYQMLGLVSLTEQTAQPSVGETVSFSKRWMREIRPSNAVSGNRKQNHAKPD